MPDHGKPDFRGLICACAVKKASLLKKTRNGEWHELCRKLLNSATVTETYLIRYLDPLDLLNCGVS
jgi:hypothetical protein